MVAAQAAIFAAKTGLGLSREIGKQISLESNLRFQYDFPGLIVKLTVFFLVAYAINKVFEAIIFGENTLKALLSLLGLNLPSTLPEPIVNFFQEGIKGFKYWDLVKIIATLLVIAEWYSWNERTKGIGTLQEPFTHGVFAILVSGLILITIPEVWQRLKEIRAMNQTVITNG